jgi:flagellar FliL protein
MARNKEVVITDNETSGGKGKLFMIIGTLILLAGGGGAGFYYMNLGGDTAEAPVSPTEQPTEMEIDETLYLQLEEPFLVQLKDSDLTMRVKLALRTPYGQPMIDNLSAHEFGLRAGFLEELASIEGNSITSEGFRKDSAARLRDVANNVLGEQNIYGGVDLVLFTEFLVQ